MYQKQLISLQKTLSSLGVNFQIESVGKKALSRFPCPKLREQIHLHGYPSGFTMDSHRNGFKFYGIGDIKSEEIAHAGSHKERNTIRYEITKITKSENVSNDFLRFMLTDGLVKV